MSAEDELELLRTRCSGYMSTRLSAQLRVLYSVSRISGGKFDDILHGALDRAAGLISSQGALTEENAKEIEQTILPAGEEVKKYRLCCVAHAHIDMNWLWGYHETCSLAIDTFRTMLDLLAEYPQFRFSQSQASTYRIVEECCPEMLDEIRRYVHEGRWEPVATNWVEGDKNLPDGEQLCRHILYTKKYISDLLGVPQDSLRVDFEPDTFGHNANMPEILNRGGVKYYYQCRGLEADHILYRWVSRSGASVIVYREPDWYNGGIDAYSACAVPDYCEKAHTDSMLRVYGVGDHGGGPTRRDVERLLDMQTWPVYPQIVFSSYDEYFSHVEKDADKFPVVDSELNFVFTGCYTSQSRIKASNRYAQTALHGAETLTAFDGTLGGPDRREILEGAWRRTMFNNFHDILTGSGVRYTREFALGEFQRAMAAANTSATAAMFDIAKNINMSSLIPGGSCDIHGSPAEGSGAGAFIPPDERFGLPGAERGCGKRRYMTFFNTGSCDLDKTVEITVWEWPYDADEAVLTDSRGETVPFIVTQRDGEANGHRYKRLAARIKVPAFGWAVYTIDRADPAPLRYQPQHRRTHNDIVDDNIVLENDLIRAEFDHATMELVSLRAKADGKELIGAPAGLRYITENALRGESAWVVGNRMSDIPIARGGVTITSELYTDIRSEVKYELNFASDSHLSVTVRLDAGSPALDLLIRADFHETGSRDKGIPQLGFLAPAAYEVGQYRYDIPMGTINRPPLGHDVPANSFAAAPRKNAGASLMLVSDSTCGFRGCNDSLYADLIRASYDPDRYPEFGIHDFRLGICATGSDDKDLYRTAGEFLSLPGIVSTKPSKNGTLPLRGSFMTLEGAQISGVKAAQDGRGIIVRFYDDGTGNGNVRLRLRSPVRAAALCDTCENDLAPAQVDAGTVVCPLSHDAIGAVRVEFA